MTVSRRALILAGLGVGVAGAGAGVLTDVLPGGPQVRRAFGFTGPDGQIPDIPEAAVTTTQVRSAARGQDVTVCTISPQGMSDTGLPVCVALHGRGGDANWFLELGISKFLTAALAAGAPPFTVVTVSGGTDSYWVQGKPGDDPQRMLVEELPGWLGGPVVAAIGISMGAFGALNLARRRPDLKAVAVASPAMFEQWPDAEEKGVFVDRVHWEGTEPLRHVDEFARVPLGVWCGTEDPFVDAARTLIDRARPAVAAIDRGAHERAYWLRVLPDMLAFVGGRLR